MNIQRAQQILQSLVQGIDPQTGAEIPGESVLHGADVLRALVVAIGVLATAQARAARRAQLPENVGRPWTEAEVATLRREFESAQSLEEIARAHGRSTRAITHRLARLGLVLDDSPLTQLEAGGAMSRKLRSKGKG